MKKKGTNLATKNHIDKVWKDPIRKSWFNKYATPLNDNMWTLWSEEPKDWFPYHHSCDPNAWLEGLNIVARRDIKKGDEITMEYATFCGDNLESFTCSCKSADCRGTITGIDYLKPFVEKYVDHTTDFVEGKRKQQKKTLSSI